MGLLNSLVGKVKQFGQEVVSGAKDVYGGAKQVIAPVANTLSQIGTAVKGTLSDIGKYGKAQASEALLNLKQNLPGNKANAMNFPLTGQEQVDLLTGKTATAQSILRNVPGDYSLFQAQQMANLQNISNNLTQALAPSSTSNLYRVPVSTTSVPVSTQSPTVTTNTPTSSNLNPAGSSNFTPTAGGIDPWGKLVTSVKGGAGKSTTVSYAGGAAAPTVMSSPASTSTTGGGFSGSTISRAGVNQYLPGVASSQALLTGSLPYQETPEEKNRKKNQFIEEAKSKLAEQGIYNPQFFGDSIENLSVFDPQGKPILPAGALAKQLGYQPPQAQTAATQSGSFQAPEAFAASFPRTQEGAIDAEALFRAGRDVALNYLSNPNIAVSKSQFDQAVQQYKGTIYDQIQQQNLVPEGAVPKNETIAAQLTEDPNYQKQISDYLNSIDVKAVDTIMEKYNISGLLKQQQDLQNQLLAETETAKQLTQAVENNPNLPVSLGEKRKAFIQKAADTNIQALQLKLNFAQQTYQNALQLANQELGVFQHVRDQEYNQRQKQVDDVRAQIQQLITTGSLGDLTSTDIQQLAQMTGYTVGSLTAMANAVKKNQTQKALQEQQKADIELERLRLSEQSAARSERSLGIQEQRLSLAEQQAAGGGKDKILSPQEAILLGVPYGTTQSEAQGIQPLSATQRTAQSAFAPAKVLLDQISELSNKVNTSQGGIGRFIQGGTAKLGAFLQTNPDAALFEAQRAKISLLVRALGEKGTLATGDVDRVIKGLPTLSDSKSVAQQKIQGLRDFITQVENQTRESSQAIPYSQSSTKTTTNNKSKLSDLNFKF